MVLFILGMPPPQCGFCYYLPHWDAGIPRLSAYPNNPSTDLTGVFSCQVSIP
jgi:hypothetical protein